jgi:hypothetical protein
MLEAFAKSNRGAQIWNLHKHLGVPLVEQQSELTPLQRRFLLLAADEHEEEAPSKSDVPSEARKHM